MKHLLSLLIAALPFTASAQSIKAGDMNNDGQYTIGDLTEIIAVANGNKPAQAINIILDNEHVRDYDHELFEGHWDGYDDDVYFYNDHADNASGYNTCKFQFITSFNGLVDKHIENDYLRYVYDKRQGRLIFFDDFDHPKGYFDIVDMVFADKDKTQMNCFTIYDPLFKHNITYRRYETAGQEHTVSGHKYVDLALPSGTMWGMHNVRTRSYTYYYDTGKFYQWGALEGDNPGALFYYEEYWAYGAKGNYTHYVTDANYGTPDGKTQLAIEHDAAYKEWGKNAFIPSEADFLELEKYCTKTNVTITDLDDSSVKIYGVRYTSKLNGRSIFFPVTGYCQGIYQHDADTYGYYWTSDLNVNMNSQAKCFRINKSTCASNIIGMNRAYGCCIRPVIRKLQ